jgi:hypothetical protein
VNKLPRWYRWFGIDKAVRDRMYEAIHDDEVGRPLIETALEPSIVPDSQLDRVSCKVRICFMSVVDFVIS